MRELSADPHVNISAQVPYSLRQAAVAIARQEGRTLSDEIRAALVLLVKTHETERQDEQVAVA
jgi:hypothetical protein